MAIGWLLSQFVGSAVDWLVDGLNDRFVRFLLQNHYVELAWNKQVMTKQGTVVEGGLVAIG